MTSSRKVIFAVIGVALLASAALIAQDIPVSNWTVPPFDASMFNQSGSGIRPMDHTQGDNPAVFVPFGPCRLTDSRLTSGGPGPIAGGGTRAYDFVPSGCPTIAGLQGNQTVSDPIIAWSLNFTVLNTAGPGFLFAYPTGGTPPAVSILNYTGAAGELRNNAAIVPVNAATGSFTVGTGVSATDVIIDANGVFLNTLEGGTTFRINALSNATAIMGYSPNGRGVFGLSDTYNGVWAQSGTWDALAAFGGRDGGYLQGARHGVIGHSIAPSGAALYGVLGTTVSGGVNAAGVMGVSGTAAAGALTFSRAGVRGDSDAFGVLGISGIRGVHGFVVSGTPSVLGPSGVLGAADGIDPGSGAAPWAVFAYGNTGATGTKHFLDPHPTDPSRVIAYISLEGPEAGTYFRGRGKFENGLARIPVPEHFRAVTDSEGLTVQVTPIGAMASFGVMKMDLDEIVVQSSRNVEFSYLVHGVRRSFKDKGPVRVSSMFAPESAEARIPDWLSAEQRRVLIQNGTYREDGTVNMETAQRLGWDRIWEKRNPPIPAPNPE